MWKAANWLCERGDVDTVRQGEKGEVWRKRDTIRHELLTMENEKEDDDDGIKQDDGEQEEPQRTKITLIKGKNYHKEL